MPTYEYACSACQNEWEQEQSIKDEALKTCPKCHADTARRQISRGGGFILKGGGWYSDLYSSSSNKQPEASTSGSSATPSAESTSSESKSTETKTTETKTDGGGSSTPAAKGDSTAAA